MYKNINYEISNALHFSSEAITKCRQYRHYSITEDIIAHLKKRTFLYVVAPTRNAGVYFIHVHNRRYGFDNKQLKIIWEPNQLYGIRGETLWVTELDFKEKLEILEVARYLNWAIHYCIDVEI